MAPKTLYENMVRKYEMAKEKNLLKNINIEMNKLKYYKWETAIFSGGMSILFAPFFFAYLNLTWL